MRKVITLVARVCAEVGESVWRQSGYNVRKLKRLYRRAQGLKRSRARSKSKVEQQQERIVQAHRDYIEAAQEYLHRAEATLEALGQGSQVDTITYYCIKHYMAHADRQIDQISRRVLLGERIPHEQKVFSIFEEHTEWISKGKAGVPQELGLKVCVVEDQYGFFLHHLVMRGCTDEKVAVSMMEATKERFPQLSACSFDKNFYTPENKERLEKILDQVVLPKKGKLNEEQKAGESSDAFVRMRKKHPAVESGINALENHGLDRCLDHGLRGFQRYVGLAIVARNIQVLGTLLWKKEIETLKRQQTRLRKAS
jgi:hypothetical protein